MFAGEDVEAAAQPLHPVSFRRPREPARGTARELFPSGGERGDRVGREKTQAADALEQAAVDLELART